MMRHVTRAALLGFSLLFGLPVAPQAQSSSLPAGTWRIDPRLSEVQFTVTKLGFADVDGRFRDFSGEVHYDASAPERSRVRWRVRVGSVETGEPDRDSSLQAADYFDASRFPELSFESRATRPAADGALDVEGDITIRGTSRPLTVLARPAHQNGRHGFETSFELNRYDFNVVGGRVMGRLIGRTVRVRLLLIPAETT